MINAKEQHLKLIKKQFSNIVDNKYRRGAREHKEVLWKKDDLLDEAILEAIDLIVYLLTLKQKQTKTFKN